MSALDDLVKLLKGGRSSVGTDYTGVVTKVENGKAYVQLTGSEITDTPCTMSVDAKPGDTVRVRVRNGQAWVCGNDTLPPSNEKKEVALKMSKTMKDRAKDILIDFGTFTFRGNTLVVESKNFKLDRAGNAEFSGKLNAAGGSFDGSMKFVNSSRGSDDSVEIGPDAGAPIHIVSSDDILGTSETSIGSQFIEILSTNIGTGRETVFINGSSISVAQADVGASSHLESTNLRIVEGTQGCYLNVTGVHTTSDARLKINIRDLDPEKTMRLHPVVYQFKGDTDIKRHYGFLAQEVKEIMPDAVTENEDGYLMLNYIELIAPAIAMIQDQEKRIATLEAEVKALKENK